jgi:hypothetical protein
MKSALRIDIVVPESRRIEISLPEDIPTGPAEVIILADSRRNAERDPRPSGIDAGKGWIAEDFDAPLPEDLLALFEGRS